ncbi:hypothetical protein FOL47_009171 [Perkinsus chesapeaki]|uniref:GB1/RHD3-type G domain-containing protein n=1 Tax=Perkinsus chesapeaki TaxID=330153 RepID=A0A7J6MSU3_PERCH|nr:hypothetical protein FOL47_009171 [Perkinsus chesapeaki]
MSAAIQSTPLSVSRRASNTTVYYEDYKPSTAGGHQSGSLYPPPKPPSGHVASLTGHHSTPSNASAAISEHLFHGGSSTMPGTPNMSSSNNSCISPCVQASQLPQGSTVEYYSQSLGRWIPAKVVSVIPPDDPRSGGSKVRYAGPPAGMPHVFGPSSAPPASFVDVNAAFSMFNSAAPPSSFIPGPSVGPPTVRVMRTTTHRGSVSYVTKTTSRTFKHPGKAVQLISADPSGNGKLLLNAEALELLDALGHDKQVSVVTVVGTYRSGKSYLLNRLVRGPNGATAAELPAKENKLLSKLLKLGRKKNDPANRPPPAVFKTGNEVNACTQGIWMYICEEELDDKVVIFLDCEGLGSIDRDRTYDTRLMAMALMMSSVFIYNSTGCLDETAFNGLSLVCELAKQLIAEFQSEFGGSVPGGVLSTSFLWVLRDFVLALENENGDPISSSEYLENTLRSRASKDTSKAIYDCFMDRDCDTLVQPAVNEDDLQKLDTLPDSKLRKEFLSQMGSLCGKIWRMAGSRPVTINKSGGGTAFTPAALSAFIRRLAGHLSNSSSLSGFSLPSTWVQVQHEALSSLIESLSAAHGEEVEAMLSELPLSTRDLDDRLAAAMRRIEIEYRRKALGEETDQLYQRYLDELIQSAKAQEGKVYPANDDKARDSAEEVASKLVEEIMPELVAGWTPKDLDTVLSESARLLTEKLQIVLDEIMSTTKGPRGARLMVASKRIIEISGLFVTELDKKAEGLFNDERITRHQRDEALAGIDNLKKTALSDLTAKVAELEQELARKERRERELMEQIEGKDDEMTRMADSVRTTVDARESQLNEDWHGKMENLEVQVDRLIREKEELEDALANTEERVRLAQDGQADFESDKNNEIDVLTETLIEKTGEIARLNEELERMQADLENAEAAAKEAELTLFSTTRDMAAEHDKHIAEWRERVAQLQGENGEIEARLREEIEGREKAIRIVYEEKAAATEAAHEAMTKLREEIKELKDRVARGGVRQFQWHFIKCRCLYFCWYGLVLVTSSFLFQFWLVSALVAGAEAAERQLPDIEDLEFVSLHGYFSFPKDDPRSGLNYLGTTATLVDPDSSGVYGSLLMLYNKGEDKFVRVIVDTQRLLDDYQNGKTCMPNDSRRFYRAVAETKVVGFADQKWDEPWDPEGPTGKAVELKMQNDDLSECHLDVGELSTLFHEDSTEKEGFAWLAGEAAGAAARIEPGVVLCNSLNVPAILRESLNGDGDDVTEVAVPGSMIEVRSVDDDEEEEGGGQEEADGTGEDQEDNGEGDEEEESVGGGGGSAEDRDASKKSLAPGVSEIDTEMSQIGERRYIEERQVSLMALAYAMQESAALRTGTAMLFNTHLWPLEDLIAILDERSDELEKNLDAAFQDLVDTSEKVAFPLIDRLGKEFHNVAKEIKSMPGPTDPYPLADLRAEVRGGGGGGEAMRNDEEGGGDTSNEEGGNGEGENVEEEADDE